MATEGDTTTEQPPQEPRAASAGNWLASIGTAIALCASGVSLWETVLRQAALEVYVGDNISYTRDPYGSYEVLVVPITIANTGAQDGAVVSMRLNVKNTATGNTEIFPAAYTADANYFAGRDNVTDRTRRPKAPFAPLSIAGRGRFSGTVLFYMSDFKEQRVVEPRSRIEVELTMAVPPPRGWIDKWLAAPPPASHRMTLEIGNFLPGGLLAGDMARAKPIAISAAK